MITIMRLVSKEAKMDIRNPNRQICSGLLIGLCWKLYRKHVSLWGTMAAILKLRQSSTCNTDIWWGPYHILEGAGSFPAIHGQFWCPPSYLVHKLESSSRSEQFMSFRGLGHQEIPMKRPRLLFLPFLKLLHLYYDEWEMTWPLLITIRVVHKTRIWDLDSWKTKVNILTF